MIALLNGCVRFHATPEEIGFPAHYDKQVIGINLVKYKVGNKKVICIRMFNHDWYGRIGI